MDRVKPEAIAISVCFMFHLFIDVFFSSFTLGGLFDFIFGNFLLNGVFFFFLRN